MFNKIARFLVVFVSAAMLFTAMTSVSMAQTACAPGAHDQSSCTTPPEKSQDKCYANSGYTCEELANMRLPLTGGDSQVRDLDGGPTNRGGSVPLVSNEYLADDQVEGIFMWGLIPIASLIAILLLVGFRKNAMRSRR